MAKKRSLGFGFSDELAKVKVKTKHFEKAKFESWEDQLIPNFDPDIRLSLEKSFWRITIFFCLMCIVFFALFVRLFHLQIVNGQQNANLADGNRIQIKVIHAPRGVIYDRNGKILAANSPGFRLVNPETEQSSRPSGTKKTIFLTREEAFALEVKNDPRAANLEIDSIRKYPYGEATSHIIGFVGEISDNQLQQSQFKDYRLGDRIGQSGIESFYEKYLRGKDGGEIIEVDSKGNKLRSLRTVAPIPGRNIYLTVDMDLQAVVFKNLEDSIKKAGSCCGAAVAADPFSGEILALVSYPSYDNNLFTHPDSSVEQILNDPDSPVLNRVIGGSYPPGSTFKIISSIAALGSGKITPQTVYEDTGVTYLGQFKFTNWYFTQYGKTEGAVDLVRALKRSNDTYFYKVGQVLGEQILAQYAQKLKLGSTLGIDLAGEVGGLVPSDEWKQKAFNQVWYPGDTLHMAIGQGFVLTTPLQVLGFTSYLAADGRLFKPHLLLKIVKDNGSIEEQVQPENLVGKIIPQTQLDVVKTGLTEVPRDGGTAWPFFPFPIPTAGKTGTAEYGDPQGKTHAWYTSFAPVVSPKVALAVLIEGGGEGSSVASPVAKEIYRWYFSEDKNNLLKDSYSEASTSVRSLGE